MKTWCKARYHWIIALAVLLEMTLVGGVNVNLMFHCLVPHARDLGFSAADAALLQSTMLLLLAVGKLVTGILCDKIGARRTTVLCVLVGGLGMWLLADAHSMARAMTATVLFSLGLPLLTLVVPLLVTSLFGCRAHDSAVGIILSMNTIANLVGTVLIHGLFDVLGSYTPVLQVGLLVSALVVVLYEILYREAARLRRQREGCKE